MSYIGKNPKADTLNLTPQSALPTTPSEGMLWRSDGTVRGVGLFEYKSGNWIQVDEQLGDSDTLDLQTADGCNLTYNANWYCVGSVNIQGRSDTWGAEREDLSGTGTNDFITLSTTAADLLNSNGVSVIKFAPTDATAGRNAYFGKRIDLQQGWRGSNLVVEFRYKTAETSGDTTGTDWLFVARDASLPPLEIASQGTNTLTTSALAAVVAEDGTTSVYQAPAVGDAIMLTDTSNNTYIRYITVVTGTANAGGTPVITYSGTDLTLPTGTDANATAMPGIFTSLTQYLPASDDQGSSYKAQVKTDTDTKTIEYGIMHISTQTDQQIYVDNLLLSANKFLQASSQFKSECWEVENSSDFYDAVGDEANWDKSLLVPRGGSPAIDDSKVLEIAEINSGTTFGTVTGMRARVDCKLDVQFSGELNDSAFIGLYTIMENNSPFAMAHNETSATGDGINVSIAASICLSKDEYIWVRSNGLNARTGAASIVATPQVSPVILLESQDEIFTDWVSYDITRMKKTASDANHDSTGFGTNECNEARWRRVGDSMEIQWNFRQSTAGNAGTDGTYVIPLPDGYSIDTTKVGASDFSSTNAGVTVGYGRISASADTLGAQTKPAFPQVTEGVTWGLQLGLVAVASNLLDDTYHMWASGVFDLGTNPLAITMSAKVPIQGWNANFNPLLSMPLVEIGGNTEQGLWETAAGYSTAATKTQYFSNETFSTISSLGTVVNNSTDGWKFTASQKCKVTAVQVVASSAAGSYWGWSLNATSITTSIDALSFANGRRVVEGNDDANSIATIPITTLMEPGDVLRPQGGASTLNLTSYQSVQIVVEKDFSNTNMAHIIKPAVACLINSQNAGSTGGTIAAGTSWTSLKLNVAFGETWFVTGAFDGNGGTNTNFTLEPGTYECDMVCPVWSSGVNGLGQMALYNVTDSTYVEGSMFGNYYNDATAAGGGTFISGFTFTITASKEYRMVAGSKITATAGTYTSTGVPSGPALLPHNHIKIRKLK